MALQEMDRKLLSGLMTERRNPRTQDLDLMSAEELLRVMNEEDHGVVDAVRQAIPQIAKVVKVVIRAFESGGRLVYAGAGTSGRLGILDAAECMPTFSAGDKVVGVMAGGEQAFVVAKEGAEDSREAAREDLQKIGLTNQDVLVALTASGRTPYCIGALEYAREVGAYCVGVSCNCPAVLSGYADTAIEVETGPEILTGSTRLKAGTAQKMVLNMISTASMVGIGKVYKNLMVDMKATNLKLEDRAVRIVCMATDCSEEEARYALAQAGGQMKAAIVMILAGVSCQEAQSRLGKQNGFVRRCL
ncbi:MAG: N-acetylmuramic acid 6-phosphate etherase [Eubacteriales bacterium]|nr:N-acetylmuramic acid 6-phosphate etherase [Eubacteriales bacterium]